MTLDKSKVTPEISGGLVGIADGWGRVKSPSSAFLVTCCSIFPGVVGSLSERFWVGEGRGGTGGSKGVFMGELRSVKEDPVG
jgi:hypothetical protein